jgi:hypothetical protein
MPPIIDFENWKTPPEKDTTFKDHLLSFKSGLTGGVAATILCSTLGALMLGSFFVVPALIPAVAPTFAGMIALTSASVAVMFGVAVTTGVIGSGVAKITQKLFAESKKSADKIQDYKFGTSFLGFALPVAGALRAAFLLATLNTVEPPVAPSVANAPQTQSLALPDSTHVIRTPYGVTTLGR